MSPVLCSTMGHCCHGNDLVRSGWLQEKIKELRGWIISNVFRTLTCVGVMWKLTKLRGWLFMSDETNSKAYVTEGMNLRPKIFFCKK